jgi:ribose-phosphate pyrophosphokinase
VKWFKQLNLHNRVFASPDVGNVKRAQVYANMLGGEIAIIDKRRKSGSDVETRNIIGDVEGKNILMVDDMITTAGTVTQAVKMLKENGAADIYISASHAIFAPPAMERLTACPFTRLAVTDTIPIGTRAEPIKDRLEVLSVSGLLGEAIHRIHHNESVSALFKDDGKKRDGAN